MMFLGPAVARCCHCPGAANPCRRSHESDDAVSKIERVEIVPHAREKPRLAAGLVLPVDQTALPPASGARPLGRGIPFPQLPARRGVERDDLSGRRRGEQHAVDRRGCWPDTRRDRRCRSSTPGEAWRRWLVDLCQPRIVGARRVAEIGRPVRAGAKRARRRRRHRSALTRDPNRSQDARGERCRAFLVDTPRQATHGLPSLSRLNRFRYRLTALHDRHDRHDQHDDLQWTSSSRPSLPSWHRPPPWARPHQLRLCLGAGPCLEPVRSVMHDVDEVTAARYTLQRSVGRRRALASAR